MKDEKNKILVTAYADNQLKSPEELRLFEKVLKEDPSLEFDLNAELLTKKILRNKYSRKNLPDGRREELITAIQKENVKIAQKKSFRENIYSRRFIGFSTAAVILIAFILLMFNRPTEIGQAGISEQSGENNMLVLAVGNFEKFMEGNNSAQFISSNPRDIKDYFRKNGVKYETYIPVFDNYTLVGASVSEHRGVRLAHHFYATKDGKYIYVFQVCENYFKGDSIILITNDLLNYLKQGNKYKHSHSNYTAIMSHKNNTLFAMVSNAPVSELPESIVTK